MEYMEGGNGIEVEDLRRTFSEGFVMSTRYNAEGEVDSLPKTANFVFETFRMEFIGMSTRPSGSSTAFEV